MTISYTGDVANASDFGCFNKILLKWKGSVYKLIYKVRPCCSKRIIVIGFLQELLAYLLIYLLVNVIYRKVLIPNSQCEIRDSSCKEVSPKSNLKL